MFLSLIHRPLEAYGILNKFPKGIKKKIIKSCQPYVSPKPPPLPTLSQASVLWFSLFHSVSFIFFTSFPFRLLILHIWQMVFLGPAPGEKGIEEMSGCPQRTKLKIKLISFNDFMVLHLLWLNIPQTIFPPIQRKSTKKCNTNLESYKEKRHRNFLVNLSLTKKFYCLQSDREIFSCFFFSSSFYLSLIRFRAFENETHV